MRSVASAFLIIFFVLISFISLLTATFKFQLLDYNFWQRSFEKNNVYQNLAVVIKNSLESQIEKEGGSKNEVKVLTDLITTENLKDFIGKNIQNILSFVNGRTPQVIAYIPVSIIPKSLLPKNLIGIQSEIPLKDLLTKFNYQNYQSLPLQELGSLGRPATFVFMGLVSVLAVIFILLVLLVKESSRLTAPGIAVFSSGVLTLIISKIGGSLKTLSSDGLSNNYSLANILAGNLLPPLIKEFMKTWSIIVTVLVIIGVALFFVRKPSYNIPK